MPIWGPTSEAGPARAEDAVMATREEAKRPPTAEQIRGYGQGGVETVISVEDVNRQAAALAGAGIPQWRLAALAGGSPFVSIEGLRAGYGKMQILHGFDLPVAKGQENGRASCRERVV